MDSLIDWIVQGVPIGCIFGLVAIGLVLTYKTSGVFNLAFSGQAFFCAWFWYDRIKNHGWPIWLAFVVTVFVIAPLTGVLLDRALFRYMRTASWQVKLVSALGLLVAFPEIVKAIYSYTPGTFAPSLAGFIGRGQYDFYALGDNTLSPDSLIVIIFTVLTAAVLGLLFRYTAVGLQMRALVESPRMVELAGVNADRVGLVAWMLSSTMAGLAGVLLVPQYTEVNGTEYQLVIVAAIAAGAVGRFQSIPMTLVGAIGIGFVGRMLQDVFAGTDIEILGASVEGDVRPSLPFLVLFLLLIFWSKLREGKAATDPLSGVDPPPPALAHEYKDEALQKTTKILFPVFMAGFVLVMLTLVSDYWISLITLAFVFGTIFMSITVFTGLGGQISLASASFASVGAFGLAHLNRGLDVPLLLALPIAAVGAAIVGAILIVIIDGLPAIVGRFTGRPPGRLTGLYLSLATLAFALMMDKTVFRREAVIKGDSGFELSRPEAIDDSHRQRWFLIVLAVWAIVAFLVILVRKGSTGRYMAALRGSDPAAASVGINARVMRIKLFALSAGVAGLGGGLLTLHNQAAIHKETLSFLGLVWVVLVVTLGARTVDGAINAALGYVLFQNWLLPELGFEPTFAIVLFGLGAITYARHPEGIVQFQTRKNIVSQIRQRALGQRANDLKGKGELPKEFRPVRFAAGPVIAGPALYFAYILIGSLFTDGWLSVRSPTILFFILPSLLYAFAWILVTNFRLQRDGGFRFGWLVLAGGALVGALGGLWFDSKGWPLVATQADRLLVGIAAGFAVAAFFMLPVHVQLIAKKRNWLGAPITWHVGRAPAGFVIFGALLFQRTTMTCSLEGSLFEKGCPPGGWPVFFIVSAWVIVWVQWVASVQSAVNELAIGGEGYEPPEEKAFVAQREVGVATPAGGAE